MRLTSSLLRLRCPGNCSAGGFPDICWGFVVRRSCSLCSFLCNSLELGPCSYLYSLEPECYSSNEGRSMSCIVGHFALEDGGCSLRARLLRGESPKVSVSSEYVSE